MGNSMSMIAESQYNRTVTIAIVSGVLIGGAILTFGVCIFISHQRKGRKERQLDALSAEAKLNKARRQADLLEREAMKVRAMNRPPPEPQPHPMPLTYVPAVGIPVAFEHQEQRPYYMV